MDCLMCCRDDTNAAVCIDGALEIIRKHFSFYKSCTNDKDKQLRLLQERNEKLTKAVCLLQQGVQHKNSELLQMSQPIEAKRRRTDPTIYDLTEEETTATFKGSPSAQVLILDVENLGAHSQDHELQNSQNVREANELLNRTEPVSESQKKQESVCFLEAAKNEKVCKNTVCGVTKRSNVRWNSFEGSSDSTFCDDEIIVRRVLSPHSKGDENVIDYRTKESGAQLHENSEVKRVAGAVYDPDETFIDLENSVLKQNLTVETNVFGEPSEKTKARQTLNSSSVALLTPEDEIFLDKSFVDTDIKSMDWLNEIENSPMDKTHAGTRARSKTRADKENIKKTLSDQPSTSRNGNLMLKQEKVSQPPFTKENTRLVSSSEELDDYVVHPIMVKEELMPDRVSAKKLSLKERFNVDCQDCEKYIDFLAGQLSDEQIEQHLRTCTLHKERDIRTHQTPEGFWNPLLQSFPKDDPRNEILIDKRFLGTKRDSDIFK